MENDLLHEGFQESSMNPNNSDRTINWLIKQMLYLEDKKIRSKLVSIDLFGEQNERVAYTQLGLAENIPC